MEVAEGEVEVGVQQIRCKEGRDVCHFGRRDLLVEKLCSSFFSSCPFALIYSSRNHQPALREHGLRRIHSPNIFPGPNLRQRLLLDPHNEDEDSVGESVVWKSAGPQEKS